jgi:hypothetical protein
LLPLASLDVIPPAISTDLIFNFSDGDDQPYNKRLDEMGYGNHNAIENIGSVTYFMALIVLLILISLMISPFKCGCCLKIKIKLGIIGLLATLYMLFFESFLEILISSYLSYLGAVKINADDKFAYAISVIFPSILFSIVPLLQIYVLCKSPEERSSQKFTERYEEIYP